MEGVDSYTTLPELTFGGSFVVPLYTAAEDAGRHEVPTHNFGDSLHTQALGIEGSLDLAPQATSESQ